MKDKIIQVSGFGVNNTKNTQCDYLLVALTESGTVLMSTGDGIWSDIGPKEPPNKSFNRNCSADASQSG